MPTLPNTPSAYEKFLRKWNTRVGTIDASTHLWVPSSVRV
jgi:hypothetical protein